MGAWVDDENAALVTDLYELTMAASYMATGMEERATFELFVRELPSCRSFLVACGLELCLEYLEALRFDEAALDYLGSLGRFDEGFLRRLGELRFGGDVWAVPEGEVIFAGEPLLRVTASLPEAQLVETFLVNMVSFQTMVATKAARVALACGERRFVDFSARRDHGPDAALKAARAAFVGGAAATSNVLAGKAYGIPLAGTMAHSFVMAFDDEAEAFRTFARQFPYDAVLLIDTYDTMVGARRAVEAARQLVDEGVRLRAVRLDSGDLAALAAEVRRILDEGGQYHVEIFASGDLDEYRIAELVAGGAPIDAFGVGTQLGTSGDAPSLAAVYKLVESASGPALKLSRGKSSVPGRKQVCRFADAEGRPLRDMVSLHDEEVAGARPLLRQVMLDGRRTTPAESLEDLRRRCRESVASLPPRLQVLDEVPEPYEVLLSPRLEAMVRSVAASRGIVPRNDDP